MKVLFITHYAALYGANRSLLNLIEGIKPFGYEILVLCPERGEITEELNILQIPFVVSPFPDAIYRRNLGLLKLPLKIIKYFTFLLRLNWFKKYDPDIIYTNSSVIIIGAILSRLFNKSHIWHIREFSKEHYGLKYDFGLRSFKYLLNRSKSVVAISNAIKAKVCKGITSRVYVVYNGVIKQKHLGEPKNLPIGGSINLAVIGFIGPSKNQLEAIQAFKAFNNDFPDSNLLIVGDGSKTYIKTLKEEAAKLNVSHKVTFTGYIKDVEKIYKEIHFLLMCSRNEGLGRVTIEAMANGVPVIGYNDGGTKELIIDDVTGYLYDGNYQELAYKLNLAANNNKKYLQMSKESINEVYRKYTIEEYGNLINKILLESFENN